MIFFSKFLKINYEYFESKEDKIPLLFLHGWGGNTKSFDFFCNKIKNKKSCINIDFPPFGKSETPFKPLTIKDYCDIIVELLSFLNVKKVDIVAHSFGGRVAIYLCASTNLVKSMLLTSSAGFTIKKNKWKVFRYKFLKFLSKIKLYSNKKLKNMGSSDYKSLNYVMKKTFSNIVSFDEKKYLKKISVPVLLVWGSFDKETPFYFTKIFKKHIKDCEVIEFKNCSHFAYLEKPNLFLNILLSYFIKKES